MDSRWRLLRNSLQGKRDESSESSIHRHDGFQNLVQKKFIVWTWNLDYIVTTESSWEEFVRICFSFINIFDHFEVLVRLIYEESCSDRVLDIIDKSLASDIGRLCHVRNSLECAENSEGKSNYVEKFLYIRDKAFVPFLPRSKCYEWRLPRLVTDITSSSSSLLERSVYCRERVSNAGVSLPELFAHQIHGVDNTGNVKVWAAEAVLLYVLLSQQHYCDDFANKCVLELGGGSTGLCALGLASAPQHSCSEVVVTDGHPDCVANQRVCIHMCKQSKSIRDNVTIQSEQLRWLQGDPHDEISSLLTRRPPSLPPSLSIGGGSASQRFDRIIASDCMFFKEFHRDLVWVLCQLLAPQGVVYMLQPRRGGTMQAFLDLAEEFFTVCIQEHYCTEVTTLHEKFLSENRPVAQSSSGGEAGSSPAPAAIAMLYDPDIHYPILVTLIWKSPIV